MDDKPKSVAASSNTQELSNDPHTPARPAGDEQASFGPAFELLSGGLSLTEKRKKCSAEFH